MAKEISCEIIYDYGILEIDEDNSIKVAEVKWNGRKPKGYDIRRYQKEDNRLSKGITIPYDLVDNLIGIFIDNNLCNLDNLQEKIEKKKSSYFGQSSFQNMFNRINNEMHKYQRDEYGRLIDSNGHIVISSRREDRL